MFVTSDYVERARVLSSITREMWVVGKTVNYKCADWRDGQRDNAAYNEEDHYEPVKDGKDDPYYTSMKDEWRRLTDNITKAALLTTAAFEQP